ncbi:MAG: family 16 glycosylhydrolase [Eubacterium sp.]|nr:family 16 glycosylhydrolase [Eubacterium sp.]
MKTYRKIISIVLTLALVMSLSIVQSPTKSFAKVKIIVGKKLDINIGSKDTILVKGRAKAKSSSKKVAKVTKTKKSGKRTKITVKGVKVGKAKIKIKGHGSKKVKVTVRPKTPKKLKVTVSGNSAKLVWSKAKGAKGYYIYRSESKSGKYKKVASSKKTNYTNKGLALGKYYYYKVIAYGNKKIKSESYSNIAQAKTWKLVWQDEFNGTALDKTKWNNEGATGAGGYGNQELQDYEWDYQEVKDGKFIIKPQFDYDTVNKRPVDGSYYSTKVWTKGKGFAQFTYGKFEFRAKMPKGKGTWAAGWMLGTGAGGGWPQCGEIDVFETTKQAAKTLIPQSIHCKKFNGMSTSSGNKHGDTIVSDATTAFHTYAVEWYPSYLRFTIDGKQTWIYDPQDYVLSGKGTDDMTIWPYKYPAYLILNCAIGGTLGGDVGPDYWPEKVDKGGGIVTYKDRLEFDYVRVYQ